MINLIKHCVNFKVHLNLGIFVDQGERECSGDEVHVQEIDVFKDIQRTLVM